MPPGVYKRTEYHNRINSQGHTGKKHSEETKNKIKIALKGRKWSGTVCDWRGRKHSVESKIKMSNSAKGKIVSDKTKAKMSASRTGKKNPMYGRSPAHYKRINYKGFCFRSSWEFHFAKFLDSRKLKWNYECKRFYFEDCSYLPDFYVYDWECWIEIKGRLTDDNIKKIKLFNKYYTEEKLILFDFDILKKLNIIKK